MKILIDIDEIVIEPIQNILNSGSDIPLGINAHMIKAIANGTPIPDNATVCDIDAVREEITEMIEKEEVYHTKGARAQIIALEWALDVIESHTKGEQNDNH